MFYFWTDIKFIHYPQLHYSFLFFSTCSRVVLPTCYRVVLPTCSLNNRCSVLIPAASRQSISNLISQLEGFRRGRFITTNKMKSAFILRLLTILSLLSISIATQVCVIGSGIAGASLSHFLSQYSSGEINDIVVFERSGVVGGRMATVTIGEDIFEAGATVIHPKNVLSAKFVELLGLQRRPREDPDLSSWVGIWDGHQFVFQTLPPTSGSSVSKFILSVLNNLRLLWRYGISLFRMNRLVKNTVEKFMLYYTKLDSRPVFGNVEDMLKWSGLYDMTQRTLRDELVDANLSELLVSELITVITRINYGQDVNISGLAGTVSLAGSDEGLWSVDGGNWQIAAGLIKHSNATLHLNEEVTDISYTGDYYELQTTEGNNYNCKVTVIAIPLDELNISFTPPISIPSRKLQHTHATFVRGILNPAYFGLELVSKVPGTIGTLEKSDIPFSSISILKKYSEDDMTYKVFSRAAMGDDLLDKIFRLRKETIKINWAAYPHYEAPEIFAPFKLNEKHLYYVNSFENAASTIEVSAVAAENVARLILSRLKVVSENVSNLKTVYDQEDTSQRTDL